MIGVRLGLLGRWRAKIKPSGAGRGFAADAKLATPSQDTVTLLDHLMEPVALKLVEMIPTSPEQSNQSK